MSEVAWISTESTMPAVGKDVLVAGEWGYCGKEPCRFVDIGIYWGSPEKRNQNIPADAERWYTAGEWYEGQEIYRITHWAEMPKHPLATNSGN